MEIVFKSKKVQALCSDSKRAVKQLGPQCAKKLFLRLQQLKAAPNLAVAWQLPQLKDTHELKGERKGQLNVKVHGGVRIALEPANSPVPRKEDGGLDWAKVTAIRILDVRDDHAG